ncbi:AAA family ATPase [Amnibacterium flavum]|uniref:AfsR/SARP family transcriptional regulator n=1 Tax=Amnibacterium flavum TaxID=2173173 RepID=UPI001401C46F|nr:AAA family ATPase [Amnibacterium flavum]
MDEGRAVTLIEVRMLGVLEIAVRDEGREEAGGRDDLRIRGDLPRALLARLAWSPGELVSTDQLIADVWTDIPESAVSTLRAHLSRLRSAGVGAALVGTRGGYVLDIARSGVDAVHLMDRIDALGAPRADESHLAELTDLALQVDRELVAGLEGAPFLASARRSFAERRRVLEEDLGETALALGDHALATAVLERLVARNPGHERPVRLFATALARQTRFSDAVDVLDAFRSPGGDDDAGGSPRIAALRTSIVRLEPSVVAPVTGSRGVVVRVGVQIPLTRFVGRSGDLSRLREARTRERLITIVGPAGVGKTRTAVELARSATTALDDEQYLVDLADVRAPDAVVGVIAGVVRATEATLDAITRRLSGRRVLLILDNADHVIGALAIAVAGLLDSDPALRVLVTSREPLRLKDEKTFVLRPFSDAEFDDAWRLLLERATDVRGGDPFDEEEEDSARRLCAELDGIPLALELAAARLDVLDADAVRAGLGAWSASGRHGSVQSAISWTFDLLGPYLQRTLEHAARFAGPFTVEAFAGIEGLDPIEAEAALRELVGRSLLSEERSETGRARLRMLESMREFMADRGPGVDVDDWVERHRRWFADLVWALSPSLRAFEARDTMAVLDGFRADIDAALDSAVSADDRRSAVLITAGLAQYWHLRGRFVEGRARLDAALGLAGPAQGTADVTAEPQDEALLLAVPLAELELANLAYQLGDAEAGFVAIAAAEAHGREAGDASTTAVALARAAYGQSLFGDRATSEALISAATELARSAPLWARSEVLLCAGQMLRSSGRLDDAMRALTRSHLLAAEVGYTWMVTSARYVLAKTLVDARRPREAISLASDSIEWARSHEDSAAGLALLHIIAGACAFVERHEIGARLFGAVDALGVRYGYSTASAEGDEAHRLRRAVAAALSVEDFDREYRNGRDLGWDDVMQLVGRLPQSTPSDLAVPTPAVGFTGPAAAQ